MTIESIENELQKRLREQEKRFSEIVKNLREAHPMERESAVRKLRPEISKLKSVLSRLNDLQETFFISTNNVIQPLGKVGRAVDMDFAMIYIKYALSFLERVEASLSVQTSGGQTQ